MRSHKSLLISQKCGQWLLCGLLHNGQCFTAGSTQTVTIRTSRLFLTLKCVHAHLCYMNNANVKCYELSLFNAHAKILIFHIFMNVNKLCLINQQRKEGFLFYFLFFYLLYTCASSNTVRYCGAVGNIALSLPFHTDWQSSKPHDLLHAVMHTVFQNAAPVFRRRLSAWWRKASCYRSGMLKQKAC